MSKVEEIVAQIDKAQKIISTMINNDLSVPVDANRLAELNSLFETIDKLRKHFAIMFSEMQSDSATLLNSATDLNRLSEQVNNTSKHVSIKAGQVATSTSDMTENMNSVSAAAEELSTNMSTVASNANNSSQNINSVAAATEQMTATISEIADNAEKAKNSVISAVSSVQNANDKIQELNKATKEINAVTSSIAGISEQTKLLALNATIEAARAGQAGVRFAVVASEVKALAVQTNNATSEIRSKVNAMLNAAQATIDEISNIHEVITNVNQTVSSIALSVDMQSDTTKEIASSINHAAHGIMEGNHAVNEANFAVREVAQNISKAASLANDVADAINEVSSDANDLKDKTTLMYVGAMEVHSHSSDLNNLAKMAKLPAELMSGHSVSNELFKFTPSFQVDIREMDGQHKGIFDYINKVHAALKSNKSHAEIAKIMADMRIFVGKHFHDEEVMMKKINYPDLKNQLNAHTNLLSKVDQIVERFNRNEDVNMIEVMVFLKDWLVTHIMGMDKKYSEPAHNHNIY
jgi:hemerythrin-like metal-binding protein